MTPPPNPVPSGEEPAPQSDPAAIGVTIGGATVVGLPILEVILALAGLGSCNGYAVMDVLLAAITIGLAAGGITTLVFASKGASGSRQRVTARRLGIVAIVMAVVSVPINGFLILLSGFCVVG